MVVINVNVIFFIFTGSILVVNTLKFNKKAKIVTPQGSVPPASSNTQDYYPWPVPFFADNDFGYISTIFPVNPAPPVPQPTSTPATQLPPATTDNPNVNKNIGTPKLQITEPLVSTIDSKSFVSYDITTALPVSSITSTTSSTTSSIITSSITQQTSVSTPITSAREDVGTGLSTTRVSISTQTVSPLISIVEPKFMVNISGTVEPATNALSSTSLSPTTEKQLPSNVSFTAISNSPGPLSNDSTLTTIIAPFTSNPLPSTVSTKLSTLSTSTTSPYSSNLESSLITSTTPVYRPLALDCNYKPPPCILQALSDSRNVILNNFQIEVPAVVKFNVSVASVPNYIVSISPVANIESDVEEIISASTDQPFSSVYSTPPNHIDLDDSHLNLNIGWTAPATTPSTTTVVSNRISQEKCLEYRTAGRRYTRKSQVQVFIIGGQNSKQNEFPHMAALGYGPKTENHNNWLCGGSLISDLYVITAAHCLSEHSLGYVSYVRLGTTTLQTETLDSEDYNIVRRIPHPNYVEGKQYDDIALLQLDRPVTFTEHISPICLFTSSSLEGRSLVAVGWGRTSETGSIAKELQRVDLDYVSINECLRAYSVVPKEDLPRGIVDATQVCAGVSDGTRDTCQGDSGGPLQLQQDGGAYLVGITSFGIGCGTPGIPGVYTRVSYYVSWIENVVWGR